MPPLPPNEGERVAALRDLRILDTPAEDHFDAVCKAATALFSLPIALVSLIDSDRQWFKAKCGIDVEGTPRDIAFCTYAILRDDVLVVEDATADSRFADNPLVTGDPGIRFYAGAPLVLRSGIRVGTLCIIDAKPRSFSELQKTQLQDFARIVVAHIELHRARLLGVGTQNGPRYTLRFCRAFDGAHLAKRSERGGWRIGIGPEVIAGEIDMLPTER